MAGQQVIVKAGAYDIEILDEDYNHIIKHRRLYGEEKESMNWIPYLELMSKRPTALKYTVDRWELERAIWPRLSELQLVPEERR
jgi:hypothetical protein